MRKIFFIAVSAFILCMLVYESAVSQRRVTPVGEPEKTKAPQVSKPENLVHMHDSLGYTLLMDTVTGKVDTIGMPTKKKMIYPLIMDISAGLDIWNPAMRLLGQKYGLGSAWVELNMHNRYFPYIEVGFDQADDTPVDANFTFKVKTAPFGKIGIGYNIFYNSNPDYQLKFGLRYGFTRYTYQVSNVTVDEGYWGSPAHFTMPEQTVTTGYWELVAGLKVKIVNNFSLGWAIKYHNILNETKVTGGKPMIVPGYGKRGNNFTGSFSLIYTFNLNKQTKPSVTSGQEQ